MINIIASNVANATITALSENPDITFEDGLKDKNIPFGSRIINLVNAYDAMISQRPYRNAIDPAEAKRIIIENADTKFDPELVAVFDKTF